MARGRMVSKSLSTSKKWNALPTWFSRMLYVLLIVHADDYGIVDGDAEEVKWKLSPGAQEPPSAFEAALCDLARADLIHRYGFNGHHLIEIILFDQHQQGLHKRSERRFPSYVEVSRNFPEIPGISGGALEDSDGVPESPGNSGGFPLNRRELNRREGEGDPKGEEAPQPIGCSPAPIALEAKTKTKDLLVKGGKTRSNKPQPTNIPPDFCLSESTQNWITTNYPDISQQAFLAFFVDQVSAKGYQYVDFQAAVRTWLRKSTPQERQAWAKTSQNGSDDLEWAREKLRMMDEEESRTDVEEGANRVFPPLTSKSESCTVEEA